MSSKIQSRFVDLSDPFVFTGDVEVPTPVSGPQAANKAYVDASVGGSQGFQGAAGVQGPQGSGSGGGGSQGYQGPLGPQGFQGIVGPQGLNSSSPGITQDLSLTATSVLTQVYTYTTDGSGIAAITLDITNTGSDNLYWEIDTVNIDGSTGQFSATIDPGSTSNSGPYGALQTYSVSVSCPTTTTFTAYIRGVETDSAGPQGIDGSQGPIGVQGVQGTEGIQGVDGSGGAPSVLQIGKASNSAVSGMLSLTGGTVSTPGDGYEYHTFTSSDTLGVTGTGTLEVIVVGGGAGACNSGGGGGAVCYNPAYAVSTNSYSVTVGTGGAGNIIGSGDGTNGSDSAFDGTNILAKGGGGGVTNEESGLTGGCGGGGGASGAVQTYGGTVDGTSVAGSGGTVYANIGGGNGNFLADPYPSGGGGGAGTAGQDASNSTTAGNGGDGISLFNGAGGTTYYGAGGGGACFEGTGTAGSAGLGGTGNGAEGGNGGNGTDGHGDGGGGVDSDGSTGGSGGAGIVIVRIPLSTASINLYDTLVYSEGSDITYTNSSTPISLNTPGVYLISYKVQVDNLQTGSYFYLESSDLTAAYPGSTVYADGTGDFGYYTATFLTYISSADTFTLNGNPPVGSNYIAAGCSLSVEKINGAGPQGFQGIQGSAGPQGIASSNPGITQDISNTATSVLTQIYTYTTDGSGIAAITLDITNTGSDNLYWEIDTVNIDGSTGQFSATIAPSVTSNSGPYGALQTYSVSVSCPTTTTFTAYIRGVETDSAGPQGIDGPQGVNGPQGVQGSPNGGLIGEFCTQTTDANAGGYNTQALGFQSFAIGFQTVANGAASYSEGEVTTAFGETSHTEGYYTIANGFATHAEGFQAFACSDNSHAEGYQTNSSGIYSHTEGFQTLTTADASHAEGFQSQAFGFISHVEGCQNITGISPLPFTISGTAVTIVGVFTGQFNNGDKVVFYNLTGGTDNTLFFSEQTISSVSTDSVNTYFNIVNPLDDRTGGMCVDQMFGAYSHAEGFQTVASGLASHAEGIQCVASGLTNHAEGFNTLASGIYAHAEGYNTSAEGAYAHTEGYGTVAGGDAPHAEGFSTAANGAGAHSEGDSTQANARAAHAEGYYSIANTEASHARGNNSNAYLYCQASQASGVFAVNGDAQLSDLVSRCTTVDAIPTEMFLDGANAAQRLVMQNNQCWAFSIMFVGKQVANNAYVAYKVEGLIYSGVGASTLVLDNSITTQIGSSNAWTVGVSADLTNGSLMLTVTGAPSTTIQWVARVQLTEVIG